MKQSLQLWFAHNWWISFSCMGLSSHSLILYLCQMQMTHPSLLSYASKLHSIYQKYLQVLQQWDCSDSDYYPVHQEINWTTTRKEASPKFHCIRYAFFQLFVSLIWTVSCRHIDTIAEVFYIYIVLKNKQVYERLKSGRNQKLIANSIYY